MSRITPASVDELGKHFDEEQQLEIVAVISMFGFLNRWNATLATELEALPARALQNAEAGSRDE